MHKFLTRSAWAIGLAGLVSIAFGFTILIWPHITLAILIKAFGLLAFVQGTAMAVSAVANHRNHSYWVLSLLWGMFGILAGIYVFDNPGISALALLFIIAAYALVRGVLDVAMGVALRQERQNDWLYIVGGLVSVAFGLYIFARPTSGAVALVWLIATYSILVGVLYIATAFSLHSLRNEADRRSIAK